jgi:outer membrane protein assembly factor BamB
MNFETVIKALEERDWHSADRCALKVQEEAEAFSRFGPASEMLLIRILIASLRGDCRGEKEGFEQYIRSYREKISLFQFVRGRMLQARLLLHSRQVNEALPIMEELGRSPLCQTDPLLSSHYALIKAEYSFKALTAVRRSTSNLSDALEKYLRSEPLVSSIYGRACNYVAFIEGKSVIDRLLDSLHDQGELGRYAFWLEKAKLKKLTPLFAAGKFPMKGLGEAMTERLMEIEQELQSKIEEYRAFLEASMQVDKAASSEGSTGINDDLFAEKGKELSALYRTYEEFQIQCCQISPSNDIPRAVLPLSFSKIAGFLGNDQAILSYYTSSTMIYGLIICASRKESFTCAQSDHEIHDLVDAIAAFQEGERGTLKKASGRAGEETRILYERLIKPVEKEISNLKRLIICPDGNLYALPFERLIGVTMKGMEGPQIYVYPSIQAACSFYSREEAGLIPITTAPHEIGEALGHMEKDSTHSSPQAQSLFNVLRPVREQALTFQEESLADAEEFLSSTLLRGEGSGQALSFSLERPPMLAMLQTNSAGHLERIEHYKAMLYMLFGIGVQCIVSRGSDNGDRRRAPWPKIAGSLQCGQGKVHSRLFRSGSSPLVFKGRGRLLFPPLMRDQALYAGGEDMHLYALNINTGEIIWKYRAFDWLCDPPVIEEGVLYFGGMDRKVRAVSATDGRELWNFRSGGWIVGTPLVRGRSVLAVSKDNTLYALDRETGSIEAARKLQMKVEPPFLGSDNVLFIFASDGTLCCYSLKGLEKLWSKDLQESRLDGALSAAGLYIYDGGKGRLKAIAHERGQKKWDIPWPSGSKVIMSDEEGSCLVLTKNCELVRLDCASGNIHWSYRGVSSSLCSPCVDRALVWIQHEKRGLIALDRSSGLPAAELDGGSLQARFIAARDTIVHVIDERDQMLRFEAESVPDEKYLNHILSRQGKSMECRWLVSMEGIFDGSHKAADQPRKKKMNEEAKPPPPDNDVITIPPLRAGDLVVYGTSGGSLVALSATTLENAWALTSGRLFCGAPVIYNELLLCPHSNGALSVIDYEQGKIIGSLNVCRTFSNTPCLSGSHLYICGDEKYLYCICAISGKIEWKSRIPGKTMAAPPLVKDKSIFILSLDGRMARLEPEFGRIFWECDLIDEMGQVLSEEGEEIRASDTFVTSMAEGEELLFLAGSGPYLFAVNPRSGCLAWRYYLPGAFFIGPPLAMSGMLYCVTTAGQIIVLHQSSGRVAAKREYGESFRLPLQNHEGRIIAATQSGRIVGLDEELEELCIMHDLKSTIDFPLLFDGETLFIVEDRRFIRKLALPDGGERQCRLWLPGELPPDEAREQPDETESPAPESLDRAYDEKAREETRRGASRRRVMAYDEVNSEEAAGKAEYEAISRDTSTFSASSPPSPREKHQENDRDMKSIIIYGLPAISGICATITRMLGENNFFQLSLFIFLISGLFALLSLINAQGERVKSLIRPFVPRSPESARQSRNAAALPPPQENSGSPKKTTRPAAITNVSREQA